MTTNRNSKGFPISKLQIREVHKKLAPHFTEEYERHAVKFDLLMKLLTDSHDGTVTREQLNASLYPKRDKQSLKSELAAFKKAIETAASAAGYKGLWLETPLGRGRADQPIFLASETPLQPPPPPETQQAADFTEQQIRAVSRLKEVGPNSGLQVFVATAALDWNETQELIKFMEIALQESGKNDQTGLACRVKFWCYKNRNKPDGLPAGTRGNPHIQEAITNSIAGLLMLSPFALALRDKYLGQSEWTRFTNERGETLKEFLAVELQAVDLQSDFGVLGRAILHDGPNHPDTVFLFYLPDEQSPDKRIAWGDCTTNAQKLKFVRPLVAQLLDKIQFELQKSPLPGTPLTLTPTDGDKIPPRKKSWRNDLLNTAALSVSVPSKAKHLGELKPSASDDSSAGVEAVPAMCEWACDPHASPYAVLLGEYGMGKTWNSRLLASELIRLAKKKNSGAPTPYYFDLRKVINSKNRLLGGDVPALDEFLDALASNSAIPGTAPLTAADILAAVREEGALLIFDGLDEVLAHKRDDAWGQAFINLLFDALPFDYWPKHLNPNTKSANSGKLLLTCRTHYFKSTQTQNEQILGVGREHQQAARTKAWQLLPFTKEQVLDYLGKHLSAGQDPLTVYDLIASVHNLPEIASRPQGLKMVCDQIELLEAAKREGKTVNGASLYAGMVQRWIDRDVGKHKMSPEDKIPLMQDLALHLWRLGARQLPWDDLAKWFSKQLGLGPLTEVNIKESLLTDLRNATFLVRPDEQNFAFAHTSILEYFLATRLYRSLADSDTAAWEELLPSPETLVFFWQHHQTCPTYQQTAARQTLTLWLSQAQGGEVARQSWLELFLLAPEEWKAERLNISGLNLEGKKFADLQLASLSADNARLAETEWKNCQFTESSWSAADCRQMIWENISGTRADFSGASLVMGRWKNVSIVEQKFDGANLDGLQRIACNESTPEIKFLEKWRLQWNDGGEKVAISADGRLIITGSDNGTAQVWNTQGECLCVLKGHGESITSCSISADSQRMITGSHDDTARVWNADGQCLFVLNGHKSSVTSCAISADGQRMITGSNDHTARVWNADGQCLFVLNGHKPSVTSCAISADGRRMITGSNDHTARVWNADGQCLTVLKGHKRGIASCSISADGQRMITGSGDHTARVWNTDGQCLVVLKGHKRDIASCSISADGQRMITGSWDRTTRVWNADGQCLFVLNGHKTITPCAISADGQRMITNYDIDAARIWDAQGNCLLVLKGHKDAINFFAISADAQRIVTVSDDNTARVWTPQGKCLHVLKGHEHIVNSCDISSDNQRIITGSFDETVRVWNAQGKCLFVLKGHKDFITSCAISADGQRMITGSLDSTVRVWNAQGKFLFALKGHEGSVESCAINTDGQWMITVSQDGTVRLWNNQGKCLHLYENASSCALSADGQQILIGSWDGAARLYNDQGTCLHTLEGHDGKIISCAFTRSGNGLMTASTDRVRHWEQRNGEWRCTLELHPATQTRVWLDARTQTLKLNGPDWPSWQLHHPDDQIRDQLGERLATLGPLAHEQLANAAHWRFWPRADLSPAASRQR